MTTATYDRRAGALEILTIVMLLSVGALLLTGILRPAGAWNTRQSVLDTVGQYVFRARAVALRASRNSWLVRDGDVLKVLVDSAGTAVQIGAEVDLRSRYGTSVLTTQDTIAFDPRGFVRSGSQTLMVRDARSAEHLCVLRSGALIRGDCP